MECQIHQCMISRLYTTSVKAVSQHGHEHEIDRRICVAAAVMWLLYQAVVG